MCFSHLIERREESPLFRLYGHLALLAVCLALPAVAGVGPWTNGQDPEYQIGQASWTTWAAATTQNGLDGPEGVAIDVANGKLYVADSGNNRVLRYSYPITQDQPDAEHVFGQTGYVSGGSSCSSSGLNDPSCVVVDSTGRLWVADTSNHRVVWFDAAHSDAATPPVADGVLGQGDFDTGTINRGAGDGNAARNSMHNPMGLAIDSTGRLWVADEQNCRVLRFDSPAAKGDPSNANGVLGQALYTDSDGATAQNRMYNPADCAVSGTTLFVVESVNNRVLRFDSASGKINGANADGVLGQSLYTTNTQGNPPTQSSMWAPQGVVCDNSGRLYVADYSSPRILTFDSAAGKANGANGDNVLGQSTFSGNTQDTTQSTVYTVTQSDIDNVNDKLAVVDHGNNRVLIFAASSDVPVELSHFSAE